MKRIVVIGIISTVLYSCNQFVPEYNLANNSQEKNSIGDEIFLHVKDSGEPFFYSSYENSVRSKKGIVVSKEKRSRKISLHPKKENKSSLTWEIMKMKIADSDDLGYTLEKWNYRTQTNDGRDTIIYGKYITIWKKLPDGTLKSILEGGNYSLPQKQIGS